MKVSQNKTRGFTMIEVMVAVGVIVILAAILIALVSGVNDKGKATRTQATMNILGESVEAFKQSTGRYPLAVPEDAWGNWANFVVTMKYNTTRHSWADYFDNTGGIPNSNWNTATLRPTNIQMLTFQLEQVPESNSILERLKQSSGQIQQMQFDNAGGWVRATTDCQIEHPLKGNVNTFQPVDAWGTPLRFWTGDIVQWSQNQGWDPSIRQLLSDRLQKANWGFFIESAGKDGRLGWWGDGTFTAQETEDNLYKP